MTPYQWFNVVSSLGYVLFTAATSTVTMLVPTIILLRPLSPNLYARVTSNIFACWWTSCLFITERLNNVGVRVTGDPLPLHVPLLIMSNHKCNLDWMFLWSAAIRTGSLFHVGVFKAIAKSEIRVIPIFGWGCKLNGFAYVRRRWASDASHLTTWIRSQIRRELTRQLDADIPRGYQVHRPEQGTKRSELRQGWARADGGGDTPAADPKGSRCSSRRAQTAAITTARWWT